MFPNGLIEIVSRVSPMLGAALGGPIGGVVGSLISSKLGGVNMSDTAHVAQVLENPIAVQKLKELELQLTDLQNARLQSEKDTNVQKVIRLMLVLFAMLALIADIYAIQYVTDKMLNEILIMMLVFLVWDIRQIYKFYFGSSGDMPQMTFMKKN